MKSLNIMGCGRVGRTLARLWHGSGCFRIQDVLTTSARSAQEAVAFIGAGTPSASLADMRTANAWMLAVPDDQIVAAAVALASIHTHGPAPLAFHCSGALASTELLPLQRAGWTVASAHCLLSFANPQTALPQFSGTPCALEGDPEAVAVLEPAFAAIGARCFAIAARHKLLYHAGAVFASNFAPVLQSLADRLWLESGVPADVSKRLQASLLPNVVRNVVNLGPAGALTGPAARGDAALVDRQGQAVALWDADAGRAYQALSALAAQLAANAGTDIPGAPS